MKIIIAGGRHYQDYESVQYYMDHLIKKKGLVVSEIVSGRATGADSLGERRAKENNKYLVMFPAQWKTLGPKAGPLRNKEMARYADVLVAFWDGESRGTGGMIKLAEEHGLQIFIYRYN